MKYQQITQARKALFVLIENARMLRLPADIVLELFETCAVPVLLYGAEIWGCENTGFSSMWEAREIDTAKFKACFSQRCKYIFQEQWHE